MAGSLLQGLARLGPRTALRVRSGHDAVGCSKQRKGKGQCPSPPGLARLG